MQKNKKNFNRKHKSLSTLNFSKKLKTTQKEKKSNINNQLKTFIFLFYSLENPYFRKQFLSCKKFYSFSTLLLLILYYLSVRNLYQKRFF